MARAPSRYLIATPNCFNWLLNSNSLGVDSGNWILQNYHPACWHVCLLFHAHHSDVNPEIHAEASVSCAQFGEDIKRHLTGKLHPASDSSTTQEIQPWSDTVEKVLPHCRLPSNESNWFRGVSGDWLNWSALQSHAARPNIHARPREVGVK